jgi:hypothetical protein
MSVWVGSYDPETRTVKTAIFSKGELGCVMTEREGDAADGKPVGKKRSVQEASADTAMGIADACEKHKVDAVVVETAPQWNVPIRLSAAATYGVLRGRGVVDVRYSSPSTKAKAIEFFAEQLGISGELERPPAGTDKTDKRSSAKVRLINKRNAVMVVDKLLAFSGDAVGLAAFAANASKKDDMADALLLACGTAFSVQKEREKLDRKTQRDDLKRKKNK